MSLGNHKTRNDNRENKSIGENMKIFAELQEKFQSEGMTKVEAETKAFNLIKEAAAARRGK
jgi:hypothetical protein